MNHVDQHHCTVSDLFVFFILITDSVCIDVNTTFNSSCYFTNNGTNGTRDEAKDFCDQRGAHLVFIETAEENSFLFNFTRGKYCIIFLCIKLKWNKMKWFINNTKWKSRPQADVQNILQMTNTNLVFKNQTPVERDSCWQNLGFFRGKINDEIRRLSLLCVVSRFVISVSFRFRILTWLDSQPIEIIIFISRPIVRRH